MDKQKVLIVDDISTVRDQLRDSLEEANYIVNEARNATEAIEKVRDENGKYDFILMDEFLPGKGEGIKATEIIHKEFKDVRILMLTNYGGAESIRQAIEVGAYRYIFRPCFDEYIISVMKAADALKELEQGLKQESLLRNVIERAGVGISIIDKTYRILYMNETRKKISMPDCKTGGICWIEYNGDLQRREPCPWCPVKPALEKGKTQVGTTLSPIGGEIHFYHVVAGPIFDKNGNIIGAMEFVQDITEQHHAERATLEAREPKERLQAALTLIRSLGYYSARLFEISEDERVLIGREQIGNNETPIKEVILPINQDDYIAKTIKNRKIQRNTKEKKDFTQIDQTLDRKNTTEWIDLPLITKAKPLGIIEIDIFPVPSGWEKVPNLEHVYELLSSIATYASQAIVDEREIKRLQEEPKRLRELRRLSERIASKSNLDEDLQTIVDSSAEFIRPTIGVHLRLLEDGHLILKAGKGRYYDIAKEKRRIVPLSDSGSGAVVAFKDKKSFIEPDAKHNNFFNNFKNSLDISFRKLLDNEKSFATFPIIFDGEVLGTLTYQSDKPSFFGPSVCEAIEDFMAIIGPIIGIKKLIDELRRAQTQLTEAARMAAHRIRNPNFAVQGRVKLWQDHFKNGTSTESITSDTIKAISEDTTRIAGIVDDLRRFLKSTDLSLSSKLVDINAIIKRTISGLDPKVNVIFDFSETLPQAFLDESLLGEIIEELISNACKAMENQGELTVRTAITSPNEKILYGFNDNIEFIKIEINDTGPGIVKEEKRRIFEPFHTTRADGTGLGLAFVHDVVQRMGGIIREVGIPGKGAKFVLFLPENLENDSELYKDA